MSKPDYLHRHNQATCTLGVKYRFSASLLSPTVLHSHMAGILTPWAFQRVKEHLKRSSNEEVMTFRIWRSHVVKPSRADLTCLSSPTALYRHMDGILTQWAFHRVQDHPKRSSDEEVMTFQSWRSHIVKPSQAYLTWPSCPDLDELS